MGGAARGVLQPTPPLPVWSPGARACRRARRKRPSEAAGAAFQSAESSSSRRIVSFPRPGLRARGLQWLRPAGKAEAPPARPALGGGEALRPSGGNDACLQTRGRERRGQRRAGWGEGCRQRGQQLACSSARTLTPPAVAHPVPSSLPRLRLRGLLFSGSRRRRCRRGIQPEPSPPPPGRDPTMHFFSHPHRPTLPCGMPLGKERRAGGPRHDSWLSGGTPQRCQGFAGTGQGTSRARGRPRGKDSGLGQVELSASLSSVPK